MKNFIKIALLLLLTIKCLAQNQIKDIQNTDLTPETGVYYKDIYNVLDPYVGSYLYTNGTTSLKIVLKKMLMSKPNNNRYFEDEIIGEYRYIASGSVIIDNLSILYQPIPFTEGIFYSLSGNSIINRNSPFCRTCNIGETALLLGLVEDSTDNWALVAIRKTFVNNQPAINIHVQWQGPRHIKVGDPPLLNASFPGGNYILLKE